MNSTDKYCSSCNSNKESDSKTDFQKRVKSFLSFNFTIFILMMFGIKIAILWKISIIWGAYLAFCAWSGDATSHNNKRCKTKHSREQYGRPQRPDWRDKDLV